MWFQWSRPATEDGNVFPFLKSSLGFSYYNRWREPVINWIFLVINLFQPPESADSTVTDCASETKSQSSQVPPAEIKEEELTRNETKEDSDASLQVSVCEEASKDEKDKGCVCTPKNERFVVLSQDLYQIKKCLYSWNPDFFTNV